MQLINSKLQHFWSLFLYMCQIKADLKLLQIPHFAATGHVGRNLGMSGQFGCRFRMIRCSAMLMYVRSEEIQPWRHDGRVYSEEI
jgi:hypothetical protein